MKPDWLTKALLIAILVAQLLILLRPHPAPVMAQDSGDRPQQTQQNGTTPRFEHLRFFTYPNGATGIFDPTDGMLYLYDTNLDRSPIARQLNKPGDPMKRVKG